MKYDKKAPAGSVGAKLDRMKNISMSTEDMVLERFSSPNLEQPPKQGSNHSFNTGGIKIAKVKKHE